MLTRDGYRFHARKMREKSCVDCGTTESLCAHHINGDWTNNNPSNLQTLCRSCHTSLHHRQGDLIKKSDPPPCKVCGKPSYRLQERLCNTHRTRLKRHGSPLLKMKKTGVSWHLSWDHGGLSGPRFRELQAEYRVESIDLEDSATP